MALRLEGGRVLTALFFLLLATIACFMPAQNDTWWHLRAGLEMTDARTLLLRETFSHTALGTFWWNHSWLSQLLFYGAYHLGGLPLLAFGAAVTAVASVGVTWRLCRGSTQDRVLLFALAFPSVAATWALRPQLFSSLLLIVVVGLIQRGRRGWIPVVLFLWANLHAGVVIGFVPLVADVATAALFRVEGLGRRLAVCGASLAATLLTPFGLEYWSEVIRSLERSRANRIGEWLPPTASEHAFFWLIAAVFAAVGLAWWKRASSVPDRTLILTAALVLLLALGAQRNVGAFALLAAAAISRLVSPPGELKRHEQTAARLRPGTFVGATLLGASVVGAGLIVGRSWSDERYRPDWTPVSAQAAAAIRACSSPIYNHYNDGGFLIWFVPEQPVFLDSRQDPYPVDLIRAQQDAERSGDFDALFSRHHVNCVVAGPESRAAASLDPDTWQMTFRDARWQVWAARNPRRD